MDENDASRLKPSLGLVDATAISVGAIIGAGIYVVTGIVASLAGPALVISMIVAAIVALFTALSFADLSAWLPREGSVYEFSYRLISPFAGFLAGWMWMLGNIFTGGAVALGFASYFISLFPFAHPKAIAILLCLAFTLLNYIGIRQSASLNNLLVATKLLILSFFILLGMRYLDPGNFQPFVPSEAGIIYGACYIFFAFGGFARVSVVAEEVEDAEHNVPRAILLSLFVSIAFYLLIGAVAVGLVGSSSLADSSSPLTTAMSATGNMAAVALVSLGGLVATASVLLTSILGISREAYAMARRNALPTMLGRLHPVHNTPYFSIWTSGALIIITILFVGLQEVVAVSAFGQLFYYALANISDMRLKRERGKSIVLPALGTISCLSLLAFLFFTSPYAWAMGSIILAMGVIYYAFRRKLRSRRIG